MPEVTDTFGCAGDFGRCYEFGMIFVVVPHCWQNSRCHNSIEDRESTHNCQTKFQPSHTANRFGMAQCCGRVRGHRSLISINSAGMDNSYSDILIEKKSHTAVVVNHLHIKWRLNIVSDTAIFWAGLMGAAMMPLVQVAATAATAPEIAQTAKSIVVQITESGSQGSGVILQRQGDVYTVLTAAHVVKNKNSAYTIATADGRKYQAIGDSIRRPGVDIDLAVVKFRSAANYPIAKLGNSNVLKEGMDLYVAGYPLATKTITNSVFVFRTGTVSANSNQVFENGYSLVYSNDTLPGMSGGAVLNQNGELVAIHGRGDREINSSGDAGAKTGFNLGIPIARFGSISANLGVNLTDKIINIPQNIAPKADDFIALAAQKYQKRDYRGALADYDRAIQLNPNYVIAYNYRGVLKENKLNDIQGALADYNRAIQADPNNAIAHYNRGSIKEVKLGDIRGGLADYNRAIQLDPTYANAYSNRGLLKENKLNDLQGALADYNRAIQADPKNAIAHYNRGSLKEVKLNDPQGGLDDYNRAIQINPYYTRAYNNRGLLKENKLDDLQSALVDYNRAIQADSQNDVAHYNRGSLKAFKLGNIQGGFADFNRAIQINPSYGNAYINRGVLKYNKLGDRSGGIADMQQAAKLFKSQNSETGYRITLGWLKKWGVSEGF
jgi:tetratricopeptide (TPR) repeat protein/S1-C subfamily serine protease